jgi:hypothetical protein
MNDVIEHQAEAYRLRAGELRATADGTRDRNCREALQRLAEGYDRLAQNLDRVAARSSPDLDTSGTG